MLSGGWCLWVPNESPLDLPKLGIKALLDPVGEKNFDCESADCALRPRGRSGTLRHFGIYDQVSSRLVMGENISQAAQFVESGNAQAGLVALSHALAPAMKDKGRYWVVPLDAYPTLNQAAVVLSESKQQDARAQVSGVSYAHLRPLPCSRATASACRRTNPAEKRPK